MGTIEDHIESTFHAVDFKLIDVRKSYELKIQELEREREALEDEIRGREEGIKITQSEISRLNKDFKDNLEAWKILAVIPYEMALAKANNETRALVMNIPLEDRVEANSYGDLGRLIGVSKKVVETCEQLDLELFLKGGEIWISW